MSDPSQRPDGPSLIAFWGSEAPDNEFRLGTREYDWHSHLRGQLFCVESGLVHIQTGHGSWLLPPNRAGWIPSCEPHKVSVVGALSGWGVLLTPEAGRLLPEQPCVIGVSELLRALVRRATAWTYRDHLEPEEERAAAVLLDEISRAPHEPLHLPMPRDKRLLRIATALVANPGDERTLDQWAKLAGLSPRTARRLFLAETGMGFNHWRQQARLTHALEGLARGKSVAAMSFALGYATPSNFIAMFRRSLGNSPAQYLANRKTY